MDFAGLAFDEVGRRDQRPPLVLLHGLTFDRSMWQPALAELARQDPGRRAIAFDLPGHGGSAQWDSYDIQSVAAGVNRAVEEAGIEQPVLVGHSLAAIVATIYAMTYPTPGVVNVDQPLQTAPFAGFLKTIADQLRGPGFPAMWEHFAASMHIELLPEDSQELLRSTSNPQQDLVLGYWREVLERPIEELIEQTSNGLGALRTAELPYLIVAGEEPSEEYRTWLHEVLPQAEISVLPGSGHFPHLAHPEAFARALAATGRWATNT
jgi:pimeloyl-ACP methyl ester carboxylesterase